MTVPLDMRGYAFHVGCKVARAIGDGILTISTVTRIENNKIYLDDSKISIRFPKRLLIIEQDPLYKMMKDYDKDKNDPIG